MRKFSRPVSRPGEILRVRERERVPPAVLPPHRPHGVTLGMGGLVVVGQVMGELNRLAGGEAGADVAGVPGDAGGGFVEADAGVVGWVAVFGGRVDPGPRARGLWLLFSGTGYGWFVLHQRLFLEPSEAGGFPASRRRVLILTLRGGRGGAS